MKSLQKLALSAMFAALVCVATMIIKIPSPLKGYINLGDCFVLLCGWVLPSGYGFLAAGIGSALADIFSGYAVYAPATFAIKGLMAVISYLCFKALSKKVKEIFARLFSGALAETAMILGYLLFEGFMYGFVPSLANIPANAVQGVAGLALGIVLINIFKKQNLIKILK